MPLVAPQATLPFTVTDAYNRTGTARETLVSRGWNPHRRARSPQEEGACTPGYMSILHSQRRVRTGWCHFFDVHDCKIDERLTAFV